MYSEYTDHFFPIRITFAPNERAWRKLMREIKCSDAPYPTHAASITRFTSSGNVDLLVATFSEAAEQQDSVTVMGLIVHECNHIVRHCERAINGGRLEEETECYLLQSLVMWLSIAFAESGRKFKEP